MTRKVIRIAPDVFQRVELRADGTTFYASANGMILFPLPHQQTNLQELLFTTYQHRPDMKIFVESYPGMDWFVFGFILEDCEKYLETYDQLVREIQDMPYVQLILPRSYF
jgi:hypothetical protein